MAFGTTFKQGAPGAASNVANLRDTLNSIGGSTGGTLASGQQPAATLGQSATPNSPPPVIPRPDIAKRIADSQAPAGGQAFVGPQPDSHEDTLEGRMQGLPASTGFNKRLQDTGVGPTTLIEDRRPARPLTGTIPRQGTIGVIYPERIDQRFMTNWDTWQEPKTQLNIDAGSSSDFDRNDTRILAQEFQGECGLDVHTGQETTCPERHLDIRNILNICNKGRSSINSPINCEG
jgi:hypothetical protein